LAVLALFADVAAPPPLLPHAESSMQAASARLATPASFLCSFINTHLSSPKFMNFTFMLFYSFI
jgi:hypothetical protein